MFKGLRGKTPMTLRSLELPGVMKTEKKNTPPWYRNIWQTYHKRILQKPGTIQERDLGQAGVGEDEALGPT